MLKKKLLWGVRSRNSATGAAITNNETLKKSIRIFSVFPGDNMSFPDD